MATALGDGAALALVEATALGAFGETAALAVSGATDVGGVAGSRRHAAGNSARVCSQRSFIGTSVAVRGSADRRDRSGKAVEDVSPPTVSKTKSISRATSSKRCPFGTANGREQILATIHQWHAGGITAGKRHMIGAWRVDVDGSRATSMSSYWVLNAKDGTAIVASGGYSDELTKRDGVWKLQKRVQTIDPSFKM